MRSHLFLRLKKKLKKSLQPIDIAHAGRKLSILVSWVTFFLPVSNVTELAAGGIGGYSYVTSTRRKYGLQLISSKVTVSCYNRETQPVPWGVDMKIARRNAEKTKVRVLQTAEKMFVRRGYEGTEMDQIAQEAGVNKMMVYACFGNKKTLYREVLKKTYREFR